MPAFSLAARKIFAKLLVSTVLCYLAVILAWVTVSSSIEASSRLASILALDGAAALLVLAYRRPPGSRFGPLRYPRFTRRSHAHLALAGKSLGGLLGTTLGLFTITHIYLG